MTATFAPDYAAWSPGLDNDRQTLGACLDSLPGNLPGDISPLVRLFENPCSPLALRGAVSLARHDCLHAVLGRGLLNQDEAFVLGFTMGSAKTITPLETGFFRFVARWLYPDGYRFSADDLAVFDLGVEAGRSLGVPRIYRIPLETRRRSTLGALRRELGLRPDDLRAVFRREQQRLPHSPASRRLPV